MPYDNNGDYYNLHDLREKVNGEIYQKLSETTLVEIYYLVDGSLINHIDLHSLKDNLKISYDAMAKIIEIIMPNNWIKINLRKEKSKEEINSSDLLVSLTDHGRRKAINLMHNAYKESRLAPTSVRSAGHKLYKDS